MIIWHNAQSVMWFSTSRSHAYLVVDICNVHDKLDPESEVVPHDPSNNVRLGIIPRMPQMRMIIYRWTTDIPGDLALLNWHKGDRSSWLQGVVYFQLIHCGGRVGRKCSKDRNMDRSEGSEGTESRRK